MLQTTASMNERVLMPEIRAKLGALSKRWRTAALPIMQSALAAGLSWLVAVHVVDHRVPFFAPIAAVICLGITLGQRLRRGIELVAGVTIGIGIGDLLIYLFGTGPWQIALVVALAMSAAILIDGGPVITIQSAVSAVLVATLYLPGQTSGATRMVDALIGGVTGLAVAAALPGAPLRVVHRQAGRVLAALARALHDVAGAIRDRDLDRIGAIQARGQDDQRMVDDLRAALETAGEIAMIAPSRWRERPRLERFVTLIAPADAALQNTRVLVRRAGAAIRAGEEMPPALCEAVDELAEAVRLLSTELAEGRGLGASRCRMQNVARSASEGLIGIGGMSRGVVLAQLRSTVVDLLQATGMARTDAVAVLPAHPETSHVDGHVHRLSD